jgi:tetratricopeptide (TPR) repeat protein
MREALGAGTTILALKGQRSAGKSAAVAKLARLLAEEKKWPVIFISLPRYGDDAAAVALLHAASQLKDSAPQVLSEIQSPRRSWNEKLELVAETLAQRPGTILLFDNPRFDFPRGVAQTIFALEAYELTQKLLGVRGLRKVVTTASSAPLADATEVILPTRSVASEVLQPKRWNGLGPYAERLLKVGGTQWNEYSPFELRLAVALVAKGVDPSEILANGWHYRELVRRLLSSWAGQGQLKKVIGRLSLLREPFDEEFLIEVGAAQLDQQSAMILRQALLFNENGRWSLHDLLAREARDYNWLTKQETIEAHRQAARYHQARFDKVRRTDDFPGALRQEMECVYHLIEAGDAETIFSEKFSIFFSEQYDALGKSLSLKERYAEAVRAYERALEHNSSDWYAHHYLAYNLDILAKEPQRAEEEYRKALERRSDQVWFHGRLICFLITTGRLMDAKKAWGTALAKLLPGESGERGWIYDELHRQVAWLLLHRGQLEFAERVLADVPSSVQETAPWYRSFTRFMRVLQEAEENKLVFPPSIPVEQRWNGPHLILDPADAARVEDWYPGRIVSVDARGVHIRIAKRDPRTGHERYGWRDLTNDQLHRLSSYATSLKLPAGTFVELVVLRPMDRKKSTTQELILSHTGSRNEDFSLGPAIFPPPDRYILSAFTSSTT